VPLLCLASRKLPVANARVNNLQNISEGFDITLRHVPKVFSFST